MPLTRPRYWRKACNHLKRTDAKLARIITSYRGDILWQRSDSFSCLSRAIVGQQISVKAADSVWHRLETMLGKIIPEKILMLNDEQLRSCGLTRQKSHYLKNIAEFFVSDDYQILQSGDTNLIRTQLLAIKGVGQWTWEMFAIFYLQLPDILPISDLGLINACKKIYGHSSREAIINHARCWQPYRTVATWYLWRSIDPVVVSY